MKAAAIIVAAGAGKRFKSATPKQFVRLGRIPVFAWSVQTFRSLTEFIQIILVVPSDRMAALAPAAKTYSITLVAGGRERIDSVRSGLAALQPDVRYVAIHDAARPLVSAAVIRNALRAARTDGAAVVAVPARDTVKVSASGRWVDRTMDRAQVWLAQTPQVFRRTVIEQAYHRLRTAAVTDDAQVVELSGRRVRIVPGETTNGKITEPDDLAVARLYLNKRKR